MRRIEKEELRKLTVFVVEQFFEKEQFQVMLKGIEPQKARQFAEEFFYPQLCYLYRQGDIFIDDKNISGVIIGVDSKRKTFFSKIPLMFSTNRAFKMLSKTERELAIQGVKTLQEIHNAKWFKKYCQVAPYDFSTLAIDKVSRGTGLCREMLEHLFDYAKPFSPNITVITHSKRNIPMYEHFGFKLMESQEARDKSIAEYRMIKKTEQQGNL